MLQKLILGILIVLIVGWAFFTFTFSAFTTKTLKDLPTPPKIPERPANESPPPPPQERTEDELPFVQDGRYTDPLVGYSVVIPEGYQTVRTPGYFYDADALDQPEGGSAAITYAGTAIGIREFDNQDNVTLENWFDQEGWSKYSIASNIKETTINGHSALEYEGNWGTGGVSVSVLMDVEGRLFNFNCHYPRSGLDYKSKCQQVLPDVVESFGLLGL